MCGEYHATSKGRLIAAIQFSDRCVEIALAREKPEMAVVPVVLNIKSLSPMRGKCSMILIACNVSATECMRLFLTRSGDKLQTLASRSISLECPWQFHLAAGRSESATLLVARTASRRAWRLSRLSQVRCLRAHASVVFPASVCRGDHKEIAGDDATRLAAQRQSVRRCASILSAKRLARAGQSSDQAMRQRRRG